MVDFSPIAVLSLLAKSKDVAVARLTLQTSYGLTVEISADGSLQVRLSETTRTSNESKPQPNSHQPGFQYHVLLDYQTNHLWYENWDDTDEFGTGPNVDDDDLRERYAAPWCDAYDVWVDRYTQAFEAAECHLGSYADPFPDVTDRAVFQLEGMLLATWLALQPGVDSVKFPDYETKKDYQIVKDEPSKALASLIDDLRERRQRNRWLVRELEQGSS